MASVDKQFKRPKIEKYQYRDPAGDIALLPTTSAFGAPSTRGTQATSSAFHPASGRHPYAHKQLADEKQKLVRAELKDSWTHDTGVCHAGLLETFFPNPNHADGDPFPGVSSTKYRNVVAKYHKHKGWRTWPTRFKKDTPELLREKSIGEAVEKLINSVIISLGFDETRVAVDRQNFPLPTHDGGELKPDIFLWGKGSPAFPPISDAPSSTSISRSKRSSETHNSKKRKREGSEEPWRAAKVDWPWCIMPIEIKTQKARGKNKDEALIQLGTYVREVLVAQENRRFMPSMVVTEHEAEFVLWDRAGVVVSHRINYRHYSELFCRMLVSFVTWSDRALGFDPTVFYPREGHDRKTHIRSAVQHTLPGDSNEDYVEYVVEETLFRSYTLRGRGSTCWRVRKWGREDDDTRYIVLDSWVKGGKTSELDIYRKLEDAGVETGYGAVCIEDVIFPVETQVVATADTDSEDTDVEDIDADSEDLDADELDAEQLDPDNSWDSEDDWDSEPDFESMEAEKDEVRIVRAEGKLEDARAPYRDAVNNNRKDAAFKAEVDLVHTRTILQYDGAPLQFFKSSKELVEILQQAIKQHWKMFEAGVVHRDIVPWNILIQRDETTGLSHGVLIDLSCAASSTEPGATLPRPEETPGSSWFMSASAHTAPTTTSYLDDLQSFYWILYALVSVHMCPLTLPRNTLSSHMDDLVTGTASAIHTKKNNHFYGPFKLEVDACFGEPVEDLLRSLHIFFRMRVAERDEAHLQESRRQKKGTYVPPTHTNEGYNEVARKHYQTMVEYFTVAIKELELSSSIDETLGEALVAALDPNPAVSSGS